LASSTISSNGRSTAGRLAVALCALTLTLSAGTAAAERPPKRVSCADVVGSAKTPTDGGYRHVLDVVSVPPKWLPEIEDTPDRPWRYWRKAGLVIRSGPAVVTVAVPKAWRGRVAFNWGNGTGVVSRLRLGGCNRAGGTWLAFAGGFVLKTPTACAPLVFTVGIRSATVRFGLGERCP
jgi:hypothetical protein